MNEQYYQAMPAKVFKDLIIYYSNIKYLWNKGEIALAGRDIRQITNLQKITNKIHPEFNYLFKKQNLIIN